MPKKKQLLRRPDYHDADLLLTLYDLRREPEMRKARDWCTLEFRPSSAEDVLKILREPGTDYYRWLRQFISYYEMLASLVHRGVLDRDLLEDSVHEYLGFYAMFKPFLRELRVKLGFPDYLKNIERLVEDSKRGRESVARIEKWLAARAVAKN